jgi:hypothetical protein
MLNYLDRNLLILGMIGLVVWGTFAACTVAQLLGSPKSPPTWDGGPMSPEKPPDAILSKYAMGVLVWGIFLTLAVATLFSIWHLVWPGPFWHRFLFWGLVTFPFSLWAGYYIIRSTRERPL